jgi:hypothetical protein
MSRAMKLVQCELEHNRTGETEIFAIVVGVSLELENGTEEDEDLLIELLCRARGEVGEKGG